MTENISDKDFMMTTSYSDIQKKFDERKDNPLYNTSYPLSPGDWARYATNGDLNFDTAYPIAYYLHIPFCLRLCRFCEYTRICLPTDAEQERYVRTLLNDIKRFRANYPDMSLYGLDIGGGTPTALSDDVFAHLLEAVGKIIRGGDLTDDFEPSIEATFQTLSDDKIRMITDAGIRRISLGIQSSSDDVLKPQHRENMSLDEMAGILTAVHEAGIRKVNLDLMYGLPNQTLEDVRQDIESIRFLNPEQVTLYELRTNQIGNSFQISQERNYQSYLILFDGLKELGYNVFFGQNTFSKNKHDLGLSSYLRHRMCDGWQYRGFGLSAQSMSSEGLSYNIGKNSASIRALLTLDTFQDNIYYMLPAHELLNKYIAVSGYFGGFSLPVAEKYLGEGFKADFHSVIQFLSDNGHITLNGSDLRLTPKGFRHYGAVLSMFY